MKNVFFFFLFPLVFACTACQDDDDIVPLPSDPNCNGELVKIVADPLGPVSDTYGLSNVQIEGLCLSFTLTKTGCGSDGWTADLLTDGAVAESLPTQTAVRIVFDDGIDNGGVTCQAEISREFTFDLTPYLGEGALPTTLSFLDTDETLAIE
ncbi:MAG: hypothetical protein AAGF89_17775, partial [Bacteroidota bacterium]